MRIIMAFAVLAVLAGTAPASGQGWSGDANLFLGAKALGEGDWGPTDRQGEFGIQTNLTGPEWPVSLAVDLLAAGNDEDVSSGGFTEQRARTSELDLGARKLWGGDPVVRPYVGGGLAFATGEIERRGPFRTVRDRDSGVGLWLDAGLLWTLSRAFDLGFDAKLSTAEVRLFGDDKNAGGLHLGLLLGYHWGG